MTANDRLTPMIDTLKTIYEERLPFNRVLGLSIASITREGVGVKFNMQDALIGNAVVGSLHGGVISATLDATGGLMATVGLLMRFSGESEEELLKRVFRIGTIDLRIDYLRPGKGETFLAQGYLLRTGNKVAVTRMELCNEEDLLIAVGTGTYIVG
jgi:uncharacterized protein (TIGR00369 family)